MRGPVPKRSEERRRRNKNPDDRTVIMRGVVEVPDPPAKLHTVAKRWYLSLADSGESQYYEPSDWAAALYVAEAMTKNLRSTRFSGQLFSSVWSAMQDMLTTESARRRSRLEVKRAIEDAEDDDRPTAIDEYKARLGG